jgi:methanogenic corrinoid protein MtbC1
MSRGGVLVLGLGAEQGVAGAGWSDAALVHAPAGQRGEANLQRAALLAGAVEREVVPRLLVAHRHYAAPPAPVCAPRTADVEQMTGFVLANDQAAQDDLLQRLRAGGTDVESLYLDLLAPAARRLGEMWEQDLCDFTEVTVGLWRLQTILRDLGRSVIVPVPQTAAPTRRVLLLPAPGEQHTFGLAVVGEFFHRDGWLVSVGLLATAADLGSAVRHESFDVVGISVGCGERMEPVAAAIRAARRGSCNPALRIMVGGPVFSAHPEFAALLGADATASDGREAVLRANALLALLRQQAQRGATETS